MSETKMRRLLKNVSYSFTANIISTLVGMLSFLIIPKLISVPAFGNYQRYIFYAGYITITALGWADGAYLRLGGESYESLDKREQSTQFWMLSVIQIALYSILMVVSGATADADLRLVLLCTCACAMVVHARYYLQLILQATNRIKEYSLIVITERVISVALCILLVVAGYRGFLWLIVLDIFGRLCSLFLGAWYCRDFVCLRPKPSPEALARAWSNISVGFMVLFSTLAGNIAIGVVRWSIDAHWSNEVFSKVSLTISIANLALRCINAVGIVMFPALRRTAQERLPILYHRMNTGLMLLIFAMLIFYYPAAQLLSLWLPQYEDGIRYAAILLPMCAYECKNAMLVSTYLKTLRRERAMLAVNLLAIAVSVVCAAVTVFVLDSIELAVLSMLVALLLRCVVGELYLGRVLSIKMKHIAPEAGMTVLFILCNWYLGFAGTWIYLAGYLVYLACNRKEVRAFADFVRDRIQR